ncbi:MAG: ATP-binding protein, partial [Gemmatimonadaceae bacterium]
VARRQESSLDGRVDLNETASSILDSQRYAIETRGIHLQQSLHPAPVLVRGDPVQLEQVLLNFLVNARQAVEKRSDHARREPSSATPDWVPSITLRTLVRDDLARVEIIDNGEGIAAADLAHIWDPFWTKRDEGEGSGLGLAVVHGIMTSHGGAVDAQSDERAGTVFSIALPLDLRPVEPAQAWEEPELVKRGSGGDPRPLDILVIDDEAPLRDLLQRIFSNRGHAVVTAADGPQAIRLAEQSSFDVVVCDLRMPGMDGRDVINRLRQLENCAKSWFVLTTGDPTTQGSDFLIGDSPVDAILAKPFKLDALLGVVEHRTTR